MFTLQAAKQVPDVDSTSSQARSRCWMDKHPGRFHMLTGQAAKQIPGFSLSRSLTRRAAKQVPENSVMDGSLR